MRANVNITRKQRHTRTLENFKGVDLSNSPLRVSTQRATYMRNLWSENGANHKRPGWREIFRLGGKINGVFPFEEGGTDVLLVHAGGSLYRMALSSGEWKKNLLGGNYADKPSQCFYRDGRAYIIGCGAYLVYGKFDKNGSYELKNVSDIAYIPTTTISIDADGVTDTARATLDDVNILTPRRKNTLVGGQSAQYWTLDGPIDSGTKVKIEVELSCTVNNDDGTNSDMNGVVVFESEPGEKIKYKVSTFPDYVMDSVSAYVDISNEGKIYFYMPTHPTIAELPNITVTFSCAHGKVGTIEKSTVATLFGTDGASDRLFISGNPAEKGMDRWSEAGDFTYFPDGNAMYVGGNESAITGYTRLSDATLAVFKEEVAGYPTIYYRTGASKTITDADGDQVPAAYFPVTPGMAGEGLVAPRAMANLSGDPLILTPSGVFGVELSANVSSGERYARERSRAIREELRKKDLSAAIACTYRGRYYLSTGDGTCYVADARYKTTFEGSADTNYEWWVWDNVPATAFAEYDGKLLFGTADGRVCVFEEGTFADRTYIPVESGNLLAGANKDYLTYGNITPQEGDVLVIGDKRYRVTDLDVEEQHLSLADEEGNALDFEDGLLTGVIERSAPVVAEWIGPVLDLGTNMQRKTLLSLGVVLEPGTSGPAEIGVETRDSESAFRARNEQGLDLGALDLGNLSFVGSFAASHTWRTNIRNFNFIRVRMRSAEDADMAVSGVTLEYKINQTNRGYY